MVSYDQWFFFPSVLFLLDNYINVVSLCPHTLAGQFWLWQLGQHTVKVYPFYKYWQGLLDFSRIGQIGRLALFQLDKGPQSWDISSLGSLSEMRISRARETDHYVNFAVRFNVPRQRAIFFE